MMPTFIPWELLVRASNNIGVASKWRYTGKIELNLFVVCFIHMYTVLVMFYYRDLLPFDIKLSYRLIALIMINTIND